MFLCHSALLVRTLQFSLFCILYMPIILLLCPFEKGELKQNSHGIPNGSP